MAEICRALTYGVAVALVAAVLVAGTPVPAWAQPSPDSFNTVLDNLRNWIIGILAGLATLFLTVAGVRYMIANGDPAELEKAKNALKSSAIGYALAALAPVLFEILDAAVTVQ